MRPSDELKSDRLLAACAYSLCPPELPRPASARLAQFNKPRVNTIFVSLLASCQLHGIDPWAYLRDLFCLLRMWPPDRILELAPAFWKQTIQQQDTQQRLAANVFRTVTLADHPSTM